MGNIDLHIHTTASDGSDSPAQLLEKIKDAGIRIFSVTDHDTIDGTLEMEQLVPEDLRHIRGVEFSCISPGGKCHILGYDFDPNDPVFQEALTEGRRIRQEKMEYRIRFLREHFGIDLTPEELHWLFSQKSPGKPHLADLLKNRGIVQNKEDAYPLYLKATDSGNDRIDAELAIRGILHAGGIPVWAHPLGGEGEKWLTREQFETRLEALIQCGIRGLECHYTRFSPQQVDFLVSQANARGLLISGGSDYHGNRKPSTHLGKLNADSTPVDMDRLTLFAHLTRRT